MWRTGWSSVCSFHVAMPSVKRCLPRTPGLFLFCFFFFSLAGSFVLLEFSMIISMFVCWCLIVCLLFLGLRFRIQPLAFSQWVTGSNRRGHRRCEVASVECRAAGEVGFRIKPYVKTSKPHRCFSCPNREGKPSCLAGFRCFHLTTVLSCLCFIHNILLHHLGVECSNQIASDSFHRFFKYSRLFARMILVNAWVPPNQKIKKMLLLRSCQQVQMRLPLFWSVFV